LQDQARPIQVDDRSHADRRGVLDDRAGRMLHGAWPRFSHAPVQLNQPEIARLDALTGEEFEMALMATMIRQNRLAVIEVRKAPGKAVHQELIDLAAETDSTLTLDVANLPDLQCNLFGNCS
jgi:hypothetical protein